MVLPLDNNAMGPVIKKAHDADVKILDYSDKALPGVDGWVIFNNLQGARLVGRNAGEWVNKQLGGKAKVALLTHEVQQTGRDRIHGAVKALQEVAPGAEVVARHEAVLSADALPVVQSMLQANPDLNVIFCIADDGCLGAEKAFMQTHPSQERIDQMYIAGWDGTVPVFQKILANSAIRATGALDLVKVGDAAIDATVNAVEGKKPTAINFPYVLASQDDPKVVQTLLDKYQKIMGS
jgi:ribose transport system substrate-binding protein